jgi:hypothetical protein
VENVLGDHKELLAVEEEKRKFLERLGGGGVL